VIRVQRKTTPKAIIRLLPVSLKRLLQLREHGLELWIEDLVHAEIHVVALSETRIGKAFPRYFDVLSRLRQAIEQPDPDAGGKGRAERGRVCRLRGERLYGDATDVRQKLLPQNGLAPAADVHGAGPGRSTGTVAAASHDGDVRRQSE